MRCGHHPGHIRDTFLRAVEAYDHWILCRRGSGHLPTVEHEARYVPRQITLAAACRLVWNCTDILPGDTFRVIRDDLMLPVKRQTYAAAARAMLAKLQAGNALA